MIKNIIFDIGGVIVEYNPKTYLDKLNLEPDKKEKLNDIIFKDSRWRDCVNGKLTENEYISELINEYPMYCDEIKKILDNNNLKYMLPPKTDTINYYNELKNQGYKIYILSNISKGTFEYIKDSFNVFKLADGYCVSCIEGVSKPNVAIYENIITKYNLIPEETIFIDDTVRNVEVGNQVGFKSIRYINTEDLVKKLNDIVKCEE